MEQLRWTTPSKAEHRRQSLWSNSCGKKEQLKWTTPNKLEHRHEGLTTSSPRLFETPVKQVVSKCKQISYRSNTNSFNVLPNHITPPSGLTKFMARNPFESDLTNRLHLSVISPTVFDKVSSPSPNSATFSWSVEELALMKPAKIEEYPMQQMHCMDPEMEVKAQAAIDQFFNEQQIIPSPWEVRKKDNKIKINIDTPPATFNTDCNTESSKSRKDGWSQTVLSLPPKLPPRVEEALKPYFTFTQEQNGESDDANSSNNSLRRKLFFNLNDCIEEDDEGSTCMTPVNINESLILACSPPQSGMLIHGTPFKCSQKQKRNHGTPLAISEGLSPNVSPIHSTVQNMSCESVRSRSRSVARLNFTADMSIDADMQKIECSETCSIDAAPCNVEEQKMDDSLEFEKVSICVQPGACSKAEVMPRNSTLFECNTKNGLVRFSNKTRDVAHAFKDLTDSCKMFTNESYALQQTNGFLGTSDQQSVSNSVQDTGYQTYSMSSTTNVTDNCNLTPVKQIMNYWSDRITLPEGNLKETADNMFCSTPSKSCMEKNNHAF